jgi:hypothetical protein
VSTREGVHGIQGGSQLTRLNGTGKSVAQKAPRRELISDQVRMPNLHVSELKASSHPDLSLQDEPCAVSEPQPGNAVVPEPQESFLRPPSSRRDVQPTKRKRGVTMPGSLFPRSPSLEPTPAPPRKDGNRLVSFTVPVNETSSSSSTSRPLDTVAEEGQPTDNERDDNPFLSKDTPAHVDRITSNSDDAKRFLEDFDLSPRSSPIPDTPILQRAAPPKRLLLVDPSSPMPAISAKAKGKQKAIASDDVYEEDNSQVVRFRGKERELREAWEGHLRKEQDRDGDSETTIILEERERDRERIRELEVEVAALKREVRFCQLSLSAFIEISIAR